MFISEPFREMIDAGAETMKESLQAKLSDEDIVRAVWMAMEAVREIRFMCSDSATRH